VIRTKYSGSQQLTPAADHPGEDWGAWVVTSLMLGIVFSVVMVEVVHLYHLSSIGRGAKAKVISSKVEDYRRGSWTYRYEIEYDGHRGTLDGRHHGVWDSNSTGRQVGDEIPVLYLVDDPAVVRRGKLGDSVWDLMIKSSLGGGWVCIGLWLSFVLVIWLTTTARILAYTLGRLSRRVRGNSP
jgi:hypothetical protein